MWGYAEKEVWGEGKECKWPQIPSQGALIEETRLMASFWLLAAMAFITYVLLAGMALGIQKRLVPTPSRIPTSSRS